MIHFVLHAAHDSVAVVVVEGVGAVANNFKGALAIPNSYGVLTRLYESA